MIEKVIYALVAFTILIILPPFLDGINRKIKAILQERQGPPVLQTYYDLMSLLSMEPNMPTDRLGFLIAPYVAFGAALTAGLLLPFGNFIPIAFTGDIFVFLYVLAIVSIAMMFAGFLVENTYANAGANREMMLVLGIEPILGISLGVFALKTGTLSISGFASGIPMTLSVILALFLFAYSVYTECAFIPFDIAEAETEILEGPLVEYSGRLFGIFKWAFLIKRVVLIWLFSTVFLFATLGKIIDISTVTGSMTFLGAQILLLFAFYSMSAVIEATTARMRVINVLKQNTVVFVAGLVVLAIAAVGW